MVYHRMVTKTTKYKRLKIAYYNLILLDGVHEWI